MIYFIFLQTNFLLESYKKLLLISPCGIDVFLYYNLDRVYLHLIFPPLNTQCFGRQWKSRCYSCYSLIEWFQLSFLVKIHNNIITFQAQTSFYQWCFTRPSYDDHDSILHW